MNTKILIEALVPTGYTNERLADHVRRVLPDSFRVFDIKVEQTPAEHGDERRREEFKKPTDAERTEARKVQIVKEGKETVVEDKPKQ